MELVLVDRYDVLGIGIQWEVWGGERGLEYTP